MDIVPLSRTGSPLRHLWHPATTGLFLAIAAILLCRDFSILAAPALDLEDASHVFAHFYTNRNPEEILRFKAGYIPLLPNLIGFAAVRLPTRLIPFGLALPPFLLACTTYTSFFAGTYRRYIRSDLLRLTTCILFALAPLFHYALISSTDYSIWNALALLILILLLPAPARWFRQFMRWLLATLLICSNPLSIVCAPLALDALRREHWARVHHLAILSSLILYQLLGVSHVKDASATSVTALEGMEAVALGIGQGARTMLRTLNGPTADLRLVWSGLVGSLVIAASVILMLVAISFYAMTSGQEAQRFSIQACYLIVAIPSLSALGRGAGYASSYHCRYIYVSSLLTLILLAAVLEAVLNQAISSQFQRWARRWSCAWLLLGYSSMNIQEGYYHFRTLGASSDSAYGQSRVASQKIRGFFETLATAESLASSQPTKLGLNRGPDWSFTVQVRPRRWPW